MSLRTTPTQAKQVHRFVRRECANCYKGDCLMVDDGESYQCVQLISIYGIYCKNFLNAVLPSDKELYEEIINNKFDRCNTAERKPL